MDLNITIDTDKNCKIVVQDNTTYLSESSTGVSKGNFKYSDTSSIVVLQHNKLQETIIKNPTYWDHSSSYLTVPIEFDGWFTVNYLVLPNREWFNKEASKTSGSALDLYSIVYFAEEDHVYKYIDNNIEETTLEEILEVNPTDTTISKISKDYISICFLQQCYINLCQQIFNQRGFSPCWNKNNIDSELIFKRDLVWMAINVIKYMTTLNQLSEVERIIEMVNGCNGLCQSNTTYQSSSSGCGCSK